MEIRKPSKHSSAAGVSKNLTANRVLSRMQMGKRRSTRIALSTSVGLSGQDRQKCAFTISVKATNLNKHGAALHLNRELLIGSVVDLKNTRGVQISARVVSQLVSRDGVPMYAVEFFDQDDKAETFWGIAFPPSN